jgi:GDPmannose 4,6-dehydratase
LDDPEQYVTIDPRYFRPHEVPYLLGDAHKAKKVLGWEPTVKFEELAAMMYDEDLRLLVEGE